MVFGLNAYAMETVLNDLKPHRTSEEMDTTGSDSSELDIGNTSRIEDKLTDRAVVQALEEIGLDPYQRCRGKPMVELQAGSRLFYQATVAMETRNELKLVFPAVDESDAVRQEWVKKSSSRIWRGSLSRKVWKHKGKGAWEPKDIPKSRGKSKGRKRKVQGNAHHERARPTDTDEGTFDENDMHHNDGRVSDDGCHYPCRRQSDGGGGMMESGQESSAFDASHLVEERQAAAGGCVQPSEALVSWFHAHIQALKSRGAMSSGCVPACGPMAPFISTKHMEAVCRATEPSSNGGTIADASAPSPPNPAASLASPRSRPSTAPHPHEAKRLSPTLMQAPASLSLAATTHADPSSSCVRNASTNAAPPRGKPCEGGTQTGAKPSTSASFAPAGTKAEDFKPQVAAAAGAAAPKTSHKPRRNGSAGLRELVGLAPSDTWSIAQHESRKRHAGATAGSASDSAGHESSRQTAERKTLTSKSSSDAGKVELAADLRATSSSAEVATSPCNTSSLPASNSLTVASARSVTAAVNMAAGTSIWEGKGTPLTGASKPASACAPPPAQPPAAVRPKPPALVPADLA